jgi:hypothetical protein
MGSFPFHCGVDDFGFPAKYLVVYSLPYFYVLNLLEVKNMMMFLIMTFFLFLFLVADLIF